ncbi:unnamed protein product, partial [Nesidiocoris tenuis]
MKEKRSLPNLLSNAKPFAPVGTMGLLPVARTLQPDPTPATPYYHVSNRFSCGPCTFGNQTIKWDTRPRKITV